MPSGWYSCNSYAISKDNTPQEFVLFVQFVFSKIKRQILPDSNKKLCVTPSDFLLQNAYDCTQNGRQTKSLSPIVYMRFKRVYYLIPNFLAIFLGSASLWITMFIVL